MSEPRVLYAEHQGIVVLKFIGDIRFTLCPAVDNFIKVHFSKGMAPVVIDLTETSGIDSTALGVLAQIAVRSRQMRLPRPSLLLASAEIRQILQSVSFDKVFNVLQKSSNELWAFKEIQPVATDEQELLEKVLTAHRNLMALCHENQEKFRDVVSQLELVVH